jgi:membrane protease YdiL (CAAX protease family)
VTNTDESTTAERAPAPDRFRFEFADRGDFPYYAGDPVALSPAQWVAWVGVTFAGFLVLLTLGLVDLFGERFFDWTQVLIFTGAPLIALWLIARHDWTALFRKVSGRDVRWMLIVAAINIPATFAIGAVVKAFSGTAENAAGDTVRESGPLDLFLFFTRTATQLLGEELVTIVPLLALMYVFVTRLGWSRRKGVLWAWAISSLVFGLLHLPTYDWNFAQCILIIGSARVILTFAYLKTKNLWVCTGAHVINDFVLFSLALAA